MASPHQPDAPYPGDHTDPPTVSYDDYKPAPRRVLRLRVAAWDVISTVALLTLLIVLATATTWPSKLFGFLADVCSDETCGLVPLGIDMYIYPVVGGGIGAAVAAATLGPFVSLLKGWYMSFWPVLALTIIMVTSVVGAELTAFSTRYWH